jgi:hypothetical protein
MQRRLILILAAIALLLQGCSTNLGFQFGSTGKSATVPSVGPGSSFSSGGVNARFSDGGSLLGVGILGALFGREPHDARTPPELDSSRRVNEQDCGQAIVNPSVNLRCR